MKRFNNDFGNMLMLGKNRSDVIVEAGKVRYVGVTVVWQWKLGEIMLILYYKFSYKIN